MIYLVCVQRAMSVVGLETRVTGFDPHATQYGAQLTNFLCCNQTLLKIMDRICYLPTCSPIKYSGMIFVFLNRYLSACLILKKIKLQGKYL